MVETSAKEYAFPASSVRLHWWLRFAIPAVVTGIELARAGGAPAADYLLFFLPRYLSEPPLPGSGFHAAMFLLLLFAVIWTMFLVMGRVLLNAVSSRYRLEGDQLYASRPSSVRTFHVNSATRAYVNAFRELVLANDTGKICVLGGVEDGIELVTRLRDAVIAAGGRFEDKVYKRACRKAAYDLWGHRNFGKFLLAALLFFVFGTYACNDAAAETWEDLQFLVALLCPVVYTTAFLGLHFAARRELFRESTDPPWREPGRLATLLSIIVPGVVAVCALWAITLFLVDTP